MNTGSTAILPAATLDEDAWEDLLSYIEEQRVIPIVGPELLQVATDRGPRRLYDWIAEKLAVRLNVDRTDCGLSDLEGRAEYGIRDFAAAAQSERTALQACKAGGLFQVIDPGVEAQVAIWLSMALAGEGKRAEAAQTIGPIVTMYRGLEKRNHGDAWLSLEFAEALYAQSLTDPPHRAALLREAAQYVDHLIPSIGRLHDTRAWRARIEAAEHSSSGRAAP